MTKNLGLFFFILFCTQEIQAFPEMVRNGYNNCTTCHVSPTGGGVLTTYGRALSKDVLSTWAAKNEERFFYAFKTPKWLSLGGDLRALELWQNSGSGYTSMYIPMERDLEGAVRIKHFTAVATFGYRNPEAPESDYWTSRRHYLQYQFNNTTAIRAGRFFPAFGIYIPEHNTDIRKDFGWDDTQESYNVEYSWLTDRYNLYVTGILGRPDFPSLYREQGGAVSASVQAWDTHKIGASYYYGQGDISSHHIFGPYGIFGFSPHFFLLSQFDGIRTYLASSANPELGIVDYQKLGYEIFQGFIVFATQEMEQLDLTNGITRYDRYGAGLQFFPRPHFEFQTVWQKTFIPGFPNPSDAVFLYAHFYP